MFEKQSDFKQFKGLLQTIKRCTTYRPQFTHDTAKAKPLPTSPSTLSTGTTVSSKVTLHTAMHEMVITRATNFSSKHLKF